MTSRRGAGFTLLEVLVALVILGLLFGILARGLDFSLRSWRAQSGAILGRSDLETVDRTLRYLVEHMDPGGFASPPTVGGEAHTLAFTTDLPMAVAELPTRTADVTLGVDAKHRLVLHWALHLPGVETGAFRPGTTELVDGVAEVEIRYWREGGSGGAWLDQWHAAALPALVRIHVIFPAGDRREWPDFIAAPMRARPVVQNPPAGSGGVT
jgi:general secretion pathway protein J